MANVLWLQGGACSGNTMSFLNAQEPTVVELVTDFGINIIWHPSMALEIGQQVTDILNDCISGKIHIDIFVFEGTVIKGPKGMGTMNYFCERPMKEWVKQLADIAQYVVAIGDCATWAAFRLYLQIPPIAQGYNFIKKKRAVI
jgi:hydrogenase small subunit